MELTETPLPLEEGGKPSHKTKKRKHAESDRKPSSKKRRHLDVDLQDAPDTPTKSFKSEKKSRSKSKSKSSSNVSQLPASSLPLPASDPSAEPEPKPDHDVLLPDAPPLTDDQSPTPELPPTSSPFHLTTSSLYLPVPAIALSPVTALPSLLTTHLAPLLLTYSPPLRGIILSVTDPVLSSRKPRPGDASPPRTDASTSKIVLAHCADDGGLSYVWLTATFLLFRPQIGDELEGWVNVCSEGFVGLVCYNYFQVAVARSRIPGRWKWIGPGGEEGGDRKGKGKTRKKKSKEQEKNKEGHEEEGDSQVTLVNGGGVGSGKEQALEEEEGGEREDGYFIREDGTRVKGAVRFRVVDCETVPGHDRETWSLQVEGTLLSPEEEDRVLEEERQKELRKQGKAVMSAGSGLRNGSVNQIRRGTPS